MESLLTTDDLAAFLKVDVVTVRRMISKGEVAAYRVGGEYRFRQEDIDAYLESRRVPARVDGRRGSLTERARGLIGEGLGGSEERKVAGSFERFTGRAAQVLVLAQEEAQALHHGYVGTEHLLLGLARERQGVAGEVLARAGVELNELRAAVERAVGQRGREECSELPLAPRAKQALELAWDEAEKLGHQFIGTEHLLLGLLRQPEDAAAGILRDLKLELIAARRTVIGLLSSRPAD